MAEVVKTAAIWNSEAFKTLEAEFEKVARRDPEMLQNIIRTCVSIKAEVVTKDEKESGLRELLNFGHSIGHAIEALMQPGMLHGEAVAIGMVKEAELARHLGLLAPSAVGRLARCIQAYKLPTLMPKLEVTDLMEKMAVDKKNKGGKKFITLLECIGRCHMLKAIPVEDPTIELILSEAVVVDPPRQPVSCSMAVPGSKSASNRALPMCALAEGEGELVGLLCSDDTQVMLDALSKVGACSFQWAGDNLLIWGNGGRMALPTAELYVSNAGTASRFLTTVCAHIKGEGFSVLTGDKRMQERPIGPLVDALRRNGCAIQYLHHEGSLPVRIPAGSFKGGVVELSADVSSQYVSSILIGAPYAEEEVTLRLMGKVVSPLYIDMTVQMMRQFGAAVEKKSDNEYVVKQQKYRMPARYTVEGDASSSTYPLLIAAITGGRVTVQNVGSDSMQGDARFCWLLEKMGCSVEQTATSTTVQGPVSTDNLRPVEIDMGDLTDAFMGAAVLMAVTPGVSKIYGIANQRLKECDRIAAMARELSKCRVKCEELPDGLLIHGVTASQLHSASIQCYNDHRIAMSFAVLGCKVPGIAILEKACVEKTYPEFWDDLVRKMGIAVSSPPTELQRKRALGSMEHPPNKKARVSPDSASVVLIGMRGAGKTTLGTAAAKALGWRCIDLDDVFAQKHGPIAEFVQQHDWNAFRALEVDILAEAVRANPTKCVLICGGGIVETPAGRSILKGLDRVVEVRRDVKDICALLQADGSRPSLGAEPDVIFRRRAPLYLECSKYQLYVRGPQYQQQSEKELTNLLRRIGGEGTKAIDPSKPSFFVALTFDNYAHHAELIPRVATGAHALEARIDLLESQEKDFVAQQISILRQCSDLPIIFTVRTTGQGGRFPEDEQRVFDLLRHGIRLGCEYVDMETCWSLQARGQLLGNRGISRIISSFHDPKGLLPWSEMKLHFLEGSHRGQVDVVKVIGAAKSMADVFALRQVVAELDIPQPVIALCMGEAGKLSRVLNTYMTPVSHSAMPMKAAPGQLSIVEIHQLRHVIGLLPKRNFYLFGAPIAKSMSPTIHNSGFQALGLPHVYSLSESESADHVGKVLQDPEFGGASVTIPHKENVKRFVQSMSPAAAAIGAINTIVPQPDGTLYGDNTDWLAMRDLVRRRLEAAKRHGTVGIVLGAGGTARAAMYVLKELGLTQFYIHNRTHDRAVQLAQEFGGTALTSLEGLGADLDVVIGTVPAAAQGQYPPALFANQPVVMDLAYRPRRTALLQQAAAAGCDTVEGIEVLIEQALFQFHMWTGCAPPRDVITKAVYRGYGE
eukprot:GGOE01042710.1.p1 GENE.GGOE01042710.1~~GGOE01042710.1.p1  ORF type:complete len:1501 (+),score=423.57 GGOE01042710.1:568-4503(+)